MKVEAHQAAAFTPRTLTITFESQEELDALAKLFNHTAVASKLDKIFPTEIIYEKLEALGGDTSLPGSVFGDLGR